MGLLNQCSVGHCTRMLKSRHGRNQPRCMRSSSEVVNQLWLTGDAGIFKPSSVWIITQLYCNDCSRCSGVKSLYFTLILWNFPFICWELISFVWFIYLLDSIVVLCSFLFSLSLVSSAVLYTLWLSGCSFYCPGRAGPVLIKDEWFNAWIYLSP